MGCRRCNYTGADVYLAVELGANVNSLPLVYGFSRISITGYGPAAWVAGSLSGSLETRLQNTGNVTGQFTLTRSSCTAGSAAAPSSITLTAGVGQTIRFSFAVSTSRGADTWRLFPISKCQVDLLSFRTPTDSYFPHMLEKLFLGDKCLMLTA